MRKTGRVATIVVCSAAIVGGIIYLSIPPKKEARVATVPDKATEEADLRRAELLLSQGKVNETLKIVHEYEAQISPSSEKGRRWLNLLIEANIQTANFGQLIILYEAYPRAFEHNEKFSIMVADGYILAKRPQEYQKIRAEWQDKQTLNEMWLVLDTDAMLLEGKKAEAIRLLKSSKFEGKKDVDRLVRLALLYVIDDPKISWDYLSEAYSLDPQNPDIITYRAKLLESLGKDSLALYEYLAAIQAAPDNLFLRDQLAEFYMRRNQVALALPVWLETLSKPSLDFIWIKALFWSKVVSPVKFDWSKAPPPTGNDKQFIEYLESLPSDTFWEEEAFEKLPKAKNFLSNLQVTFWLRLLEALKRGDEQEARNLLQFNNFSQNPLNPQLEKALKQIISYRATGLLNYDISSLKTKTTNAGKTTPSKSQNTALKDKGTFFEQLNALADDELDNSTSQPLPQDMQELLKSKEAFSAAFLAAGWLEAAIQLHKLPVLNKNFPEWVAYLFTQALRSNRSAAQALDFAIKQPRTPALALSIGELYIADNKPEEALAILQPYLHDASDIGYRAAWLASGIYADKKEYEKSKETIEAQPKLAEDMLGKEALARIALLQGNLDLADRLYTQLQDSSPEAMSYLARKAYAEKNWKLAQELTEQLLLMFPDSPILRDNLNKIMEDQKAQSAP